MNDEVPRLASAEVLISLLVSFIGVMFAYGVFRLSNFASLHPYQDLGYATSTAIVAAGIVNLTQFFVKWVDYRHRLKPFKEFWGQGSLNSLDGIIFLQSDNIGQIDQMTELQIDVKIDDRPGNRMFKAREIVNRFDAEGAKDIRAAFACKGFEPPSLETMARTTETRKAKFEIFLGLGYTKHIREVVNEMCREWLCIVKGATIPNDAGENIHVGDALLIRDGLFPPDLGRIEHRICGRNSLSLGPLVEPEDAANRGSSEGGTPKSKQNTSWGLLLPPNWAIDRYHERSKAPMMDYGYILRYHGSGKKDSFWKNSKVLFHVAGFTEEGTWAAANYLAKHWKVLHRSYVQGKRSGNFVVLLSGEIPFNPDSTAWKIERVIDRDKLHDEQIECAWTAKKTSLKSSGKSI